MGETLKAAARAAGEREAGEIMVVGDASPSTADLHVGVGGVGGGGRAGEANGPQKNGCFMFTWLFTSADSRGASSCGRIISAADAV